MTPPSLVQLSSSYLISTSGSPWVARPLSLPPELLSCRHGADQGQTTLPSQGVQGFSGPAGRSDSGMQAFRVAFSTHFSSTSLTAFRTLNHSPADSLQRFPSATKSGP